MSLKFRSVNVLTQEVHDSEAKTPSDDNRIKPCPVLPGFVPGSSPSANADTNIEAKQSNPNTPTPRRSSRSKSKNKWFKRRSEDDVLVTQYRNRMSFLTAQRLNRQVSFNEGGQVVTKHPSIAPLSDKPPPGKKNKVRLPTYGTVIKQSEYYPAFWLVKFYDGRSFYVTESAVTFLSKTSPSHKLKRAPDNTLAMQKIDKKVKNDKEKILSDILMSKVQVLPDLNLSTYEGVCELFKPHYSWLTTSYLKDHAYVMRKKLDVIQEGTWLYSLPDPYPNLGNPQSTKDWLDSFVEEDDKSATIDSIPNVTPSKYQCYILFIISFM